MAFSNSARRRNGRSTRSTGTARKVKPQASSAVLGGLGKGNQKKKDEVITINETTSFKALSKNARGYQALETMQLPPPRFPLTLAVYVLVLETDQEYQDGNENESFAKRTWQPLFDKMRSADMIVREEESADKKFLFALVSISEKRQKQVAEIMGEKGLLRQRFRSEDDEGLVIKNAGGWYKFLQHMSDKYEKSSEGTLFSSCQQCQIIEFLLNEGDPRALGPQLMQKEACEPGNSVLQQLLAEGRIIDHFYLHHRDKHEWLAQNWANSYVTKQPIEDIREYFGEEMGLFFAWSGYLLTSLWVPAAAGLIMFILEMSVAAETGSVDNPYLPLYSFFVVCWAIFFRVGWERLQLTYQHEWGLVEWEAEEEDRTEFIQNKRTYKRLNVITQKEEYFPDPFWRWIALIAAFIAVIFLIALNILIVLLVEAGKASLSELLGGGGAGMALKIVGSNLQAFVILFSRMGGTVVFKALTDFENWKFDSQYENALIAKQFCFGFVNSYFAIYFVAFMANHISPFGIDVSCPENKCIDYVEIMIAVIFLQNVISRYMIHSWIPALTAPSKEAKVEFEDEDEEMVTEKREWELQAELNHFSGINEEYAEKVIELGYVMLFGAAFPLLSTFALINNLFDLRAHATKVLTSCKRPSYRCAKEIGSWGVIIDIMSLMAIMSQCCFLAFTSTALYYYFPTMTDVQNAFVAVVIEHTLLLIKVLLDSMVEVPESVDLAYRKKEYELTQILDGLDDFDPTQDVIFYTSDDGDAYFGPTKEK